MSATLPDRIWTVGHSTRSVETFIALLQQYGIEAIADVRRFPGSRRLPQFTSAALETALADQAIDYQWLEGLGGRRRASHASADSTWRNASFRGYAEHLDSTEFAAALDRLLALATARRTAMMCAEVLWWRCHRSMISDVLKLKGIEVLHIQDERHLSPHPYTSPARLDHGELSYTDRGVPLKRGGTTARTE
ncbi:DUF488 domain-containing protein [Stutzerimonas chloritidismutans]|uniref:DUF488 domain-containing protein n=1 Tax=Stutzerimonas chloritidismutans TaxID=203192 RepID=UPI003F13FC22